MKLKTTVELNCEPIAIETHDWGYISVHPGIYKLLDPVIDEMGMRFISLNPAGVLFVRTTGEAGFALPSSWDNRLFIEVAESITVRFLNE